MTKGLRAKPEMKTLLIALKYAIAVVAAVVLDLSVYFVVVPSADNNWVTTSSSSPTGD